MPQAWCSEEAMSWFVASLLRKRGFWPIMGLGEDKFVVLSKSELKALERVLGANFVQGRHRVDFAMYNDGLIVVGVVISRIVPLTLKVSEECCKLAIEMILSSPRRAIAAYSELKRRGFDFASMNVAKMLKVVAGLEGSGRLRSFSRDRRRVGLAIVLDVGPARRYSIECVKELRSFLEEQGMDIELSLCAFSPLEISSQPPALVAINHVWGVKVLNEPRASFVEAMGLHWYGCRKCRYLEICGPRFRE